MKTATADPIIINKEEPTDTLDIGPLSKMLQDNVQEVIDPKSKEAKIKEDIAEK